MLGRRSSTSELSLLRSPTPPQISSKKLQALGGGTGSPTPKVNTDHGRNHQNFKMKEFVQIIRRRSSTPQQQGQMLSKRVMFDKDEPECVATWSRADFSWEECCSYWVQPEETQASIDRNWVIIDAHEKSKKNKDSTFHLCTRGLESYILERQRGKKIHSTKQKNARMAVLLWGRGLSDEERARRYQLVSKRCVKRALEYARRDAITARRILKEEDVHALFPSHSRSSEHSCNSTISTRSNLDLPCVPKRRQDAWKKDSDKEISMTGKKKNKGILRSCLKQATSTIPEIMPVIYVRTKMVLVKDQQKGRSKTRLASTNRTGEREGNRKAHPRRTHSTSSTLESPTCRQPPKRNRSSSVPSLRQELPPGEDDRKQTIENRDSTSLSAPDVLEDGGPDDEIQLSREAVIARLIHSAFPRCPRPSNSGCDDESFDESSSSVTTTMTSVDGANALAITSVSDCP